MPNSDKIVSLIPMEEIEQGAQKQIYDNANIPFVKKIAIMPDCHQGYDLPIGCVALVEEHISPSYVGYDIGCGMTFANTGLVFDDLNKQDLYNEIVKKIPTGFTENTELEYYKQFRSYDKRLNDLINSKLDKQYGTLGGGNHFIEIGKSNEGFLCVTIHSGSRRPGWEIGNWYMNEAKKDNQLYHKFFKVESPIGKMYLDDMNFALQFALDNRHKMLKIICFDILKVGYNKIELKSLINENHNHAIITPEGVLHRKGATPADLGQLGVIPGSMLSGVYITKGLGNAEFLSSASHGAGRKMSRGFAKKNIDLDYFKMQMEDIVANVSESTLDEAPDAYKDLEYVMNAQKGKVVNVVDYIKPLINVKG